MPRCNPAVLKANRRPNGRLRALQASACGRGVSEFFRSSQKRLRTIPPDIHQDGNVSKQREARYFYGWAVVATAALGLFLGVFPIGISSFTVFFGTFMREFHAGRAAVSLAITISNAIGACSALIVGRLCDRIGARPVILVSQCLFGLGLIAAQAIGPRLWELYIFFVFLGIVSPGTNSVSYGLVVSKWFSRRRGLALGIMMIGLGAGAIIMPPLARMLIETLGWRGTYSIVGCAALFVVVPAVAIFLKEGPPKSSMAISSGANLEGCSWHEIRSSGHFWLMIVVFVLVSASVQAGLIHLAQLMADRGATTESAAFAASVSGAALLFGRVGTGYFLDRCSGPGVARVIFAGAALGIALLEFRSSGAMFGGAFLIGLGLGAEADIIAYLQARYFGLRSFGAAFGFAFGLFVLAGGVGPFLMGLAFDRTGSYRIPLIGFSLATAIAAWLVGRLGPYRFEVKGEN